jgi:5-methylcytosine-specific restriction protein A
MQIDFDRLAKDYSYRHKFYISSEWRRLREVKLMNHPLCEECSQLSWTVPATEVHHIEDIVKNPLKALDYNNLQSLCHECHSSKPKVYTKKKPGKIMNTLYKMDLEKD